jgi:hypothetical protein
VKEKFNVGDFAFCKKGEFGLILWIKQASLKNEKTTLYTPAARKPSPL